MTCVLVLPLTGKGKGTGGWGGGGVVRVIAGLRLHSVATLMVWMRLLQLKPVKGGRSTVRVPELVCFFSPSEENST